MSQEMKLPLASLERMLPAKAQDGRKAIDQQQYGVVTINERALALPVVIEDQDDGRLSIHSDVYDYFYIPLTFGVAGLDGNQVKSFIIEVSVPDRRAADGDAWLMDVFPRLETAAGRLSAETSVTIAADLSFDAAFSTAPVASGNAKVNGESKLSWKYNPVFQSFSSVFTEATVIWSFDKVADELRAGPIDVRLLVAVKKDGRVAKKQQLDLTSHIRAEFNSGWTFAGRSASTTANIRVDF